MIYKNNMHSFMQFKKNEEQILKEVKNKSWKQWNSLLIRINVYNNKSSITEIIIRANSSVNRNVSATDRCCLMIQYKLSCSRAHIARAVWRMGESREDF